MKEAFYEAEVQMIAFQHWNSALTSKTIRESKTFEFKLTQICFNLITDQLSVYSYRREQSNKSGTFQIASWKYQLNML